MQFGHGHGSDFKDIFITHGYRQRFLLQAHSLTFLTGGNPHEAFILLLTPVGACLPVTPLHVLDHTLENHRVNAAAPLALIIHVHRLGRTVNDNILYFLGKFSEGRFQAELKLFGERL